MPSAWLPHACRSARAAAASGRALVRAIAGCTYALYAVAAVSQVSRYRNRRSSRTGRTGRTAQGIVGDLQYDYYQICVSQHKHHHYVNVNLDVIGPCSLALLLAPPHHRGRQTAPLPSRAPLASDLLSARAMLARRLRRWRCRLVRVQLHRRADGTRVAPAQPHGSGSCAPGRPQKPLPMRRLQQMRTAAWLLLVCSRLPVPSDIIGRFCHPVFLHLRSRLSGTHGTVSTLVRSERPLLRCAAFHQQAAHCVADADLWQPCTARRRQQASRTTICRSAVRIPQHPHISLQDLIVFTSRQI